MPASRPPSRLSVGNDIVDLADPRCARKVEDERFMERIFAAAERRTIRAGNEPERMLWIHWAAKEAAFKALSKRFGTPPVFRHAAFEVTLDGEGEGEVRFQDARVPFRVMSREAPLHVVALGSARGDGWARGLQLVVGERRLAESTRRGAPLPEALVNRFSARELSAVHDLASASVRLGARSTLAGLLEISDERLEIVCGPGPLGRSPPRLLLDGQPAGVDVSLSHHGAWVGWALTLPG